MAFLQQKTSNTSLLASVTATYTSTPGAGNLLVAAVTANVGVGSITITGWSTGKSIAVGIAGGLVVFYKVAGAAESTTVTASGTLATFMDLHIFEYDGIDDASPLDQSGSTADSGVGVTSRSSGTTGTTVDANELVFVAVATAGANGGGVSWTNSVTAETTTTNLMTGDKSVTAVGTFESTATWNTSQRAAGVAVTFLGETGNTFAFKAGLKPVTPRINWGNPLTKGLIFDMPMSERGGTAPVDLVSKIRGAFNATPTWITSIYGPTLDFSGSSGSNAVAFVAPSYLNSLKQMSLEFIVRIRTFDATNNVVLIEKGADATVFFRITQNAGVSGEIKLLVGYATTNNQTKITGLNLNQYYHMIVVHDLTVSNYLTTFYVNGVKVTSTSTATGSGTQQTDTTALTLFDRNTFGRSMDGSLIYMRIYNILKNAQEAKQLALNPWQTYVRP